MTKRKLILFSQEIKHCHCHDKIFKRHYETYTTALESEFLELISNTPADAAIICSCSAREEDLEQMMRLDAIAGPIPLLTCTKTLNLEFLRKAARRGAARFIVCDMGVEKIKNIISYAIRNKGLKEYFELCWPESLHSSLYIRKLIEEIIHVFPHRIEVQELAEKLGINRSWLHKLCRQHFGIPLTTLLRKVRVHQALRLMRHTNLDNTDISLQLDYSEESSLAREFRKELGYSPNNARIYLTDHSPEELLH
jgi:AraC-like DNA-binding protein